MDPRWSSGWGMGGKRWWFAVLLQFAGLSWYLVAWLCHGSEFVVKHSQNLAPRFVVFNWSLCFYASECGSSMAPARSFVPGEAVVPLPKSLQGGKLFLPWWPRGSSDHTACSQISTLLTHWRTAKPVSHGLGNGMDLQSYSLHYAAYKNFRWSAPLLFPASSFGEAFFLCSPMCILSFFFSVSLWLLSPSSGLSSLCSTCSSLPHQIHSLELLPSIM